MELSITERSPEWPPRDWWPKRFRKRIKTERKPMTRLQVFDECVRLGVRLVHPPEYGCVYSWAYLENTLARHLGKIKGRAKGGKYATP